MRYGYRAVLKILDQFQQERAHHLDAMLGKLSIVQSQFSTLQGSLVRLVEAPRTAVAAEISRAQYPLLEAGVWRRGGLHLYEGYPESSGRY
jgi:hypothetical protein